MLYGIFLLKVDFLECGDAYARALEQVSPARREKAARLKPESDRRLCVGAGLLLEYILDGLGAAGKQRLMEYAPSGRPFLPAFPGVGISIAHSGKYALAACLEGRVGADIQALIPRPEKLFRLLGDEELAFCRDDPERFTRLWALAGAEKSGAAPPSRLAQFAVQLPQSWLQFSLMGKHLLFFRITGIYDSASARFRQVFSLE